MEIYNQLDQMLKEAHTTLQLATTLNELNQLKASFLGKKGPLTQAMSHMKDLDIEGKKALGAKVNAIKDDLETLVESIRLRLEKKAVEEKIRKEVIDVTLPGTQVTGGGLHPMTQIVEAVEDLFIGLGYHIAEGPEIESDHFNFELLNLPVGHPARDMQDSFYINAETLLRTHTSPVQAREMIKATGKPLAILCPGKVYRRDADDATHSHQFMQIEGLVLGKDITLSNLKGALLTMAKHLFGEDGDIRLRPSFFPFTEPSVEVDVSCFKCHGKGCNLCKQSGWIEILGAGMVNDKVLEMCGYDTNEIQGFAFGVGVERISMLKYGIDDIRHFYTNDLRFLKQFKGVKA